MFTKGFKKHVCEGDTISTEVDGLYVEARVFRDDYMGPPWKEHDGHGPITDWVRRGKLPGEVVLCKDRSLVRYYNWQEAIELAKKDGWDAPPYGEGTKGQRAERAVKADFEAMKAWCDDEWFWCYVTLSVSKNDVVLDEHAASLCGIECNYPGGDNSYLLEVANELLDEAVAAGKAVLERLIEVG